MKKLKTINIILIIISLILLSLIYFKKRQEIKGIAYGNDVNYDYKDFDNCNKLFLSNNTCYELLDMLNKNVSKVNNGKLETISSLLKKSNYVILQLGKEDFKRIIKLNEYTNNLIYDQDILVRNKDLFLNFYSEIIDKIYTINENINIFTLQLNNPYYIDDEYIKNFFLEINSKISDISLQKKCTYLLFNNNWNYY